MTPAHNSYTGPETQHTKFTRHGEGGGQEQVGGRGRVSGQQAQTWEVYAGRSARSAVWA